MELVSYLELTSPAARTSLAIAVGVAISMFYGRRTGWSTGGLVTPGLLAIQASAPLSFAGSFVLALLFSFILRPVARYFSLYGRERVGVAILIAMAFRLAFCTGLGVDSYWIGWIVPGLIAADMERQGVAATLAATISASVAAAMVVSLFMFAGGVRP